MIDKPGICRNATTVKLGQGYRYAVTEQPAAVLINLNNSYAYWYEGA